MYRSRTSGRGGSPPPRPRAALGAAIGTALAVSVLLTIFVVYIWKGHPPIQPTEFFVSAIVTLLAILIAGAFLFATFRIEHQAMAEARVAAREVAEEVVTEELVQEAVDNHVRQNQTVFDQARERATFAALLEFMAAGLRHDPPEGPTEVE